ncbi:hypothetical protein HPC49_39705 [Pyxidicoccus fallax]|uniref:Lipoprotein n=1 Tax=Pyxidicoccus fallax TaxID=394095 RepID=A0A848LU66_9BACT|nr:hypothetical protein [Pyxidicoccus fallax]NMO21142.1 hypothetical protein [Pyxidicoccus fallax]NPC84324.1 hypothetical protein [Pyxidicoccus fallax]
MTLRSLTLACLFALGATACNPTQDTEPTAEELGTSTGAAAVTRLDAAIGDNTLSFETLGTFEERNGRRVLVIRATANRYLQDVFSFVPDDAFGEANIISERRFEVVLPEGHELNSVLSGLPLFIAIDTNTGSPRRYYARIVVAPRFFDFRGSSALFIDENVNPVYVRNGTDVLVYRGKVDGAVSSLSVTAPDGTPVVTAVDADTFRLDWQYPAVYQAIDPHTTPLTFTATLPDGTSAVKTARLVARVTELAVTDGDPYYVWPSPPCQLAAYNCIRALPTNTTDYAACGTYREVSRCMYANTCSGVPPQPLSLTEIDASSLESARVAWNAGSNPYSWSSITGIDAYVAPMCPSAPITLQALWQQLTDLGMNLPYFYWGYVTDRSGVDFGGGTRGAAFMSALDTFAGTGPIQAWMGSEEIPCHNCHAFRDYTLLYYPSSGKVLMLVGESGYDS